MTRFFEFLVAVLLGLGIGGYIGFKVGARSPIAINQAKLVMEYETAKDRFGMTDEDMADFGAHQQEWFEGIKREDEWAAKIALGALVRLESGDIEKTRDVLEATISNYYLDHGEDGDSNLLWMIKTFAATNASLSNALHTHLK